MLASTRGKKMTARTTVAQHAYTIQDDVRRVRHVRSARRTCTKPSISKRTDAPMNHHWCAETSVARPTVTAAAANGSGRQHARAVTAARAAIIGVTLSATLLPCPFWTLRTEHIQRWTRRFTAGCKGPLALREVSAQCAPKLPKFLESRVDVRNPA